MSLDLTHKQQQIFDYIQGYMEAENVPPSFRDIGAHFGLSVGTVQDQVEALRRKGFLKKEGMVARGIRMPHKSQHIPVLGRVHAGALHLAAENVEGHVPVGNTLAPSKHFALKVRGDSMMGVGILEDDLVIVRSQPVAEDGDIVVARVEDEATVKTFRRRNGRPVLEPANPKYQPITNTDFDIVGVVVELRRQFK